jgi:transposase
MRDATFSINEAAAWFGVSAVTVRGWVARYELAAVGMRGSAKLYSFQELCRIERATRSSSQLRRPRSAKQSSA